MTDKLKVVAWMHQWSFNGEESGQEPFLEKSRCQRAVDHEGGICVPLVLQSEAQAALDAALERVKVLESALERVTENYKRTLSGKPVRDVTETLAEADAAMEVKP